MGKQPGAGSNQEELEAYLQLQKALQRTAILLREKFNVPSDLGRKESFSEFLRRKLDGFDWSESELADAAGIPKGTIHDYCAVSEKPKNPSFLNVIRICRALGCTIAEISELTDFQI